MDAAATSPLTATLATARLRPIGREDIDFAIGIVARAHWNAMRGNLQSKICNSAEGTLWRPMPGG